MAGAVGPGMSRAGMSSGDGERDPLAFLAIIFFIPMFFLRAVVGVHETSYELYPGVSLVALGYLCNAFMIIYVAMRMPNRPVAMFWVVAVFFVLLSGLQLVNLSEHEVMSFDDSIGPWLRGVVWLAFIAAFACSGARPRTIVWAYEVLAKISAVAILACLTLYLLTDIAFGVHIARGAPRVQGFLSEPSGVAYAVAPLVALSVYRGDVKWFLISLAAAAASLSIIVAGVTALLIPLAWLARRRHNGLLTLCLSAIFVVGLCIPWFLTTSVAEDLVNSWAASAADMRDTLAYDSLLADLVYSRFLNAAEQLPSLLDNAGINERNTVLARLAGVLIVHRELWQADATTFGFGLNVYGTFANNRDEFNLIDFGLPSYLTSSFGVVLGTAGFAACVFAVRQHLAREPVFGVLVISFLVATLYNSAGGFHAYSIPILAVLLARNWFVPSAVADARDASLNAGAPGAAEVSR